MAGPGRSPRRSASAAPFLPSRAHACPQSRAPAAGVRDPPQPRPPPSFPGVGQSFRRRERQTPPPVKVRCALRPAIGRDVGSPLLATHGTKSRLERRRHLSGAACARPPPPPLPPPPPPPPFLPRREQHPSLNFLAPAPLAPPAWLMNIYTARTRSPPKAACANGRARAGPTRSEGSAFLKAAGSARRAERAFCGWRVRKKALVMWNVESFVPVFQSCPARDCAFEWDDGEERGRKFISGGPQNWH
nr:programmed cell death protein 7-like [Manis javanica]